MEYIREVKKGFCILSAAYIVLGIVLLIWPDISVRTFCYVFGIAMIIYGGAHLIMYFTKNRLSSVMEQELVIGVVTVSTGLYTLLKMEYMLEIIPFALGIVALLGSIVKIQDALDLKRLASKRWYLMLILAFILFILGIILIVNPFEEQTKIVVIMIGVSLLLDGIGNLIGIFWIGFTFKHLKKVNAGSGNRRYDGKVYDAVDIIEVSDEEGKDVPTLYPEILQEGKTPEEE